MNRLNWKKITQDAEIMLLENHLFKGRFNLMSSALDAYAARQRVISKNIANATSTDYRPQKVRFEEFFRRQEQVLAPGTPKNAHIPFNNGQMGAEIYSPNVPEHEVYFAGESHVNIDKEMSELAQNQIRFRFGSQMMSRYFSGIGESVSGVIK
jgi:flagellar basal-body rod protein FlgB